jgi:hypothetical protein
VNIWVARRKRGSSDRTRIGQSQGASPATASTAGVAALWLAFHGRDALLARYGGQVRLQHVFLHLVKQTARQPLGWDASRFGSGIVDAEALLRAPLPTVADLGATAVAAAAAVVGPPAPTPPARLIARMTGLEEAEVRRRLALMLGRPPAAALGVGGLDEDLDRYGQELTVILADDLAAYQEFVAAPRPGRGVALAVDADEPAPPTSALARAASEGLRARLATAANGGGN